MNILDHQYRARIILKDVDLEKTHICSIFDEGGCPICGADEPFDPEEAMERNYVVQRKICRTDAS